jgi:RNA polymerase sigma-70 factor, ECF subfamily
VQAAASLPLTLRSRADQRLVAALRARDPDALAGVHERFGAAVFGYLLHVLRDRAGAEDVFQQVMTQVWQRAHTYDPARGSLATWILTMARSRAVDELRRRRPLPLDPADLPAEAIDAPQELEIDRWLVAHLLARLPAEERRLLELRFYGGLSQTEIAAQESLALGTVKSRMVRALERLRALMDEEGMT